MKSRLLIAGLIAFWCAAPASAELVDCLLTNGQFSDGLTGWNYDSAGWGTVEFNAPGGIPTVGPTAGVHNPGPSPATDPAMNRSITGQLDGSNWIYQSFTTQVGQQYQAHGFYAGGVGELAQFNGTASWQVILYPGAYDKTRTDTAAAADVIAGQTTSATGFVFPWTEVSQLFTATNTTYTIALKWSADTPDAQRNMMGAYFDGFCVAPEPATLALLGMAFPLLRRRRA